MATMAQPVDYAHVITVSMNLAGRFTGREIKEFGQNVLKHILVEKQVGLFFGQQSNFKPNLPDGYSYVGTNKSFMCYDNEVLKASDERQYRHFLRDLHLRGHLPHHYLPDNNYVVMKMRYRHKPWTEFIAMSWVTDEKQTKLKNLGSLRKVINYITHLTEAEEMPVLVGATFRMELDNIKMEMDGDFRCYGYFPSTPRRKMRACDVIICAKPLKMHAVKPLVCGKMGFEMHSSSRWLNPEDAFYWDPVIGEVMLPIQTPESIEEARKLEQRIQNQLKTKLELSSQIRPLTGISNKHLLLPASLTRASGFQLPTAPVLPTPQENVAPPPSPDERVSCNVPDDRSCSSSGEASCLILPAIDEVSSECERPDSLYSDTETITGNDSTEQAQLSQAEQEREEKIFELLEAMMSDRTSTFFVKGDDDDTTPLERHDLDPVILNLLQGDQTPSIAELKATIRARIEAGACSPDIIPETLNRLLNLDKNRAETKNNLDANETNVSLVQVTESPIEHTELERAMLAKVGRTPSYQELYDEELIENNMQCYMS